MAKGWFKIPGVRDGDRTIEEQLLGLSPALAECKGKTILDLGCAEGVISREFARAGAASVTAIELLEPHLVIARQLCKGLNIEFICAHIGDYIKVQSAIKQYDFVLALGIIHKLPDPNVPLVFAARSAKDLVLFRAPALAAHGVIKSKFTKMTCNVPQVMVSQGFVDEKIIKGTRNESVQYWRRKR